MTFYVIQKCNYAKSHKRLTSCPVTSVHNMLSLCDSYKQFHSNIVHV